MSWNTNLALKKTLEDYCDARDAVRSLYEHGIKAIQDSCELAKQTLPHGISGYCMPRDSIGEVFTRIDSSYWNTALDLTKLSTIMDAKAMKQFRDSLGTKDMPEFTIDNVQATFLDMFQKRDEMFARGCWEVFRAIQPGQYVSNDRDPYGIPANARLILSYWFENNYSDGRRVRYHKSDTINDVDRIFRVLDGKLPNDRGLESELNGFFAKHPEEMFENEYFKVRAFKNHNGHIWFKRADLVDKVNDQIARYCGGNALPDVSQNKHHRPRPTERYEAGVPHGSV